MDRNELVEKAARHLVDIGFMHRDDTEGAVDVSREVLDAIIPDVIEAVREEAARIAEGGIDPAFDRELGASWQRSKIAAAIRAAVLGDALTTKEN